MTGPSSKQATRLAITMREHAVYADYFNRVANEVARVNSAPSTLSHYTSGESLISIFVKSELWATQLSCLNDEQELLHGLTMLRVQMKERRNKVKANPMMERFYDEFSEVLSDKERVGQSDVYVICFSTVPDDLSQWRAYGGHGGYSIGFDATQLANIVKNIPGAALAKVIYEERKKRGFLRDALMKIEELFSTGTETRVGIELAAYRQEFINVWLGNISFVLSLFKDRRFSAEKEWRLATRVSRSPTAYKARFTNRSGMLRRHVALTFDRGKIPISTVKVGPSRFPDQGRLGVKQLLMSTGYKLDSKAVLNSRIPLRQLD